MTVPKSDGVPSAIPPIHRMVSVSWDPKAAFRRFTHDFEKWWPSATHSIGQRRLKRVVFETKVGGRIFEEHVDGRRFAWGRVTLWDPPRRVGFTWHPSRDESTAQDVEVRFTPEDTGTLVELISTNWERWGKDAARARKGYDMGWGYVLNIMVGRRTFRMAMLDVLMDLMRGLQLFKGGLNASIDRSGGEMPRE